MSTLLPRREIAPPVDDLSRSPGLIPESPPRIEGLGIDVFEARIHLLDGVFDVAHHW